MAGSIGLYDLDLWHRGQAMPNLELMKIFNYHYSRNEIIRMMNPKEDEGRYSKIIYFKDNPFVQIPKSLNLSGPNKEIYGFGFYNSFFPLEEKYQDVPPSYLPYDAFSQKLGIKNYETFKLDSFVRVENLDFSGYKENRTNIWIADRDFCRLDNKKDFLQEYKNHRYKFLHSLKIYDMETYNIMLPYVDLMDRRLSIEFKGDIDFLKENYNNKISMHWEVINNETEQEHLLRIIKMGLFFKSKKVVPYLRKGNYKGELNDLAKKWIEAPSQESFVNFYDTKKVLKMVEAAPSEIRLLLKANPAKITSQYLDF